MERLTMKAEDGYERVSIRTKNQQLIDKLAYYEDLEEQDRLIKLPRDEARLLEHNGIQMLNENRRAGYNHGYAVGYNKAIDDFKSRLEERILAGKMINEKFAYIDNCDIDEVAEQLKAGGNIELPEHSKSQSD